MRLGKVSIWIEFNPHDLWIGLYWKRYYGERHFYVCVLPMLPIHIFWITG